MTPDDNLLDRIARLADELGLPNLQSKIGACRTMLRGDDSLDVAVLGRFKSGKSSLLNHIAGRDALPIGVVPLTAVITKLRYGAIERARALFLDGASRAIGLEEIGRYVSEKENPDNVRRVAAVDIELPSLERFAPLQFVDTPGLGSAFAHNTAAALEWLPNVGAAIVTVSVDAPLSERDLALLAELRRHTSAITLLLTKADLLDDAQRIEVRAFVDEQLGRQGGQAPRVHFYSVLPAHAEYKVEFERDVLLPLLRQRGSTLRRILRHKLDSLAAQAIEHARIALVAATQVESARRALAQRLALERRQLKIMRVEMRDLARQWIGGTIDDSLAALLPAQRALEARLAEELLSIT
jgi:GTP-binding protein EngB required for normal cell division